MKAKFFSLIGFLFFVQVGFSQIGIGTTTPDATLDIKASNPVTPANTDGILIPKVDAFPVTPPTIAQEGMLVFLRVTSGINAPGFYYWDGISSWIGIQGASVKDWGLTGNATTSAATNFLGTTDDVDFVIKRNNIRAGYIGNPTGGSTTVDRNNTSFGANSLLTPATGYRNTAIGTNVLPTNSTGKINVAVGDKAMFTNTTGSENTAVGVGTLFSNTVGTNNTAIGRNALTTSTASFNTAIGHSALLSTTTGTGDLAVGNSTLFKNTTGNYNTASGSQAMANNTTGNNNTALGFQTLAGAAPLSGANPNITTGNNNTAVGYQSFYNNLGGNGNVGLGYQAGFNELGSEKLYIENTNADANNALIYGEFTAGAKILRTNSTFQIGNPTTTGYSFPAIRPALPSGQILQYNAAGALTFQTPTAALNSSAWLTTGNSGMAAATNFIGTTDANPIVFRTSATERMRLSATGELSVGIGTPTLGDKITAFATGAEFAIRGTSTLSGRGIQGENSGTGIGVIGFSSGTGTGVQGQSSNLNGDAILAINTTAAGAGNGSGVYAQTSQSIGVGVDSRNLNTSGTGIYAEGQAALGSYLIAGSGGAFNGVSTGVFALNTSLAASQAIYTNNGGVIGRVNYWNGATQYKILGTGTVSTTADGLNGERVTLHCTEAPEIYFEDYGQGQLINGRTHILIDPIITKNIVVNEKHPLRVYIQLEDDCKGVYVTNKKSDSFDVIELASGNSNAKFQYHIVGNRADEVLPNGRISKNADTRFELAPKDLEIMKSTKKTKLDFQ